MICGDHSVTMPVFCLSGQVWYHFTSMEDFVLSERDSIQNPGFFCPCVAVTMYVYGLEHIELRGKGSYCHVIKGL